MKKNKPENAYNGSILFDGNMTVTLATGEEKTLRVDHMGCALKNVDHNKEVLLLMRGNAEYDEIDTGFVFFRKQMDGLFGLKPTADSEVYSIKSLNDVIAWGYADGGLNNSRVYSCQCTPEQEAELERKRKEQGITIPEAESNDYDGIVLKFQHAADGSTGVQITTRKNRLDDYITASKRWLADCMKTFMEFTEQNPDICEIHYFTKPTTWEEE